IAYRLPGQRSMEYTPTPCRSTPTPTTRESCMKPVFLRKALVLSTMAVVLSSSALVQAGVVDNQSLLQVQQGQEQRLALRELLAREDLREALVQRGVDVDVVD